MEQNSNLQTNNNQYNPQELQQANSSTFNSTGYMFKNGGTGTSVEISVSDNHLIATKIKDQEQTRIALDSQAKISKTYAFVVVKTPNDKIKFAFYDHKKAMTFIIIGAISIFLGILIGGIMDIIGTLAFLAGLVVYAVTVSQGNPKSKELFKALEGAQKK